MLFEGKSIKNIKWKSVELSSEEGVIAGSLGAVTCGFYCMLTFIKSILELN